MAVLIDAFSATLPVAPLVKTGALSLRSTVTWKALEAAGVAVDYRPYDPAFPDYGGPVSADLVCCIDVLEHIEPEFLANVLDDLAAITTHRGLYSIHTGPATKHLADGRNAHLIQKPSSWWLPQLCERFEIDYLQGTSGGFFVLVSPRKGLVGV